MNIDIEDNVPAPVQQRGRDRRGAIIVPRVIAGAMERYRDAYRAVYGVSPDITFDGTYLRVHGQPEGIKPNRLREMIQQLKWRAG